MKWRTSLVLAAAHYVLILCDQVSYSDYVAAGSLAAAREKGLVSFDCMVLICNHVCLFKYYLGKFPFNVSSVNSIA
jgi:hypothetical protein